MNPEARRDQSRKYYRLIKQRTTIMTAHAPGQNWPCGHVPEKNNSPSLFGQTTTGVPRQSFSSGRQQILSTFHSVSRENCLYYPQLLPEPESQQNYSLVWVYFWSCKHLLALSRSFLLILCVPVGSPCPSRRPRYSWRSPAVGPLIVRSIKWGSFMPLLKPAGKIPMATRA